MKGGDRRGKVLVWIIPRVHSHCLSLGSREPARQTMDMGLGPRSHTPELYEGNMVSKCMRKRKEGDGVGKLLTRLEKA